MTNETMIELCNTVSSLANDRDALQRKVDALTSQLPDREPAASAELADLRAKLALQTQIATGAATQRDEQTERLKTAMAKIEWFRGLERKWKELGDVACQYLAPFTSVGMCYVRHGLPVMADQLKAALADVERLTKERDVALSNEADARRERVETQAILNGVLPAHDVGFSADGDEYYIVHTTKIQAEAAVDRIRQLESEVRALKVSKPTSETAGEVRTKDNTSRGLHDKYRVERTDGSSRPGGKHADCRYFVLDVTHDPFAVDALRAYADACQSTYAKLAKDIRTLLADAMHSGRVSTNELTKEEVAFVRGDGVLLVSDDGLGSVPRDWFERACRARPKAGEVGT